MSDIVDLERERLERLAYYLVSRMSEAERIKLSRSVQRLIKIQDQTT